MPVNRNEYVIVNIWPSNKNRALKGANVGHVSLSIFDGTDETYVSLWPGGSKPYKTTMFSGIEEHIRKPFSDFIARPPSYKQDYERDCILEAMSERNFREIRNINECDESETPFRCDFKTREYVRLTDQPLGIRENEYLLALKLEPASFRVVLFSLDVAEIKSEFELLKQPEHISGWSMAGSNLFTRNINFSGQTTENCASIAYRCLNAGGLYSNIGSKHSAPLSSAVSPDDLIRMIVAVKVDEQSLYTGQPQDWEMPEIETPIYDIMEAYLNVGEDANITNDILPGLKPSGVNCSIL